MPNLDCGNSNEPRRGPSRRNVIALILVVAWAALITVFFNYIGNLRKQARSTEIEYGVFLQMLEDGKISKVVLSSDKYTIYPKVDENGNPASPYEDPDGELTDPEEPLTAARKQLSRLQANRPSLTDKESILAYSKDVAALQLLIAKLESAQTGGHIYYCAPIGDLGFVERMRAEDFVHYGAKYAEPLSPVISFLAAYILPTVLLLAPCYFLARNLFSRIGGGLGGMDSVGRANAKVYVEKSTGITFADVAGQDEAKESVEEIIDILHNPQKYTEIGAKLPKGVLLVGPPGTGKTLLAKAVAGEAGVPFFSISGSDFMEMFVGVGASRVRDLFKEANKMAPCIIFIDEIDTIGKSRDSRVGGNDEREQTLNQLLAELDGFDPTRGVIVLGATNRPEVLDKALLRPGRFDRRVTIDRPNLAGRLATLQVHTRNIRLAEDVDLNKIALATAGTVGSDLANLVNEAALRAVRKGRQLVTQEDLLASFEFVMAGSEKKGSVLTEFEKKLVAYHEVGHAMVAYKQKNAEPVQKITIVPHTEGSLGYTLLMPEEDKTNLRTKEELMAKITVSMGGRAAEEVIMGTMTNGAGQDIQEATGIARNMVAMFGMSEEFGMMALGSVRNQFLDGGYALDVAQDTAAVMDRAVKAILDVCYREAAKLIRENMEDMHKVVAYLLERETITGGEMVAILEGRDPSKAISPYASTRSTGEMPLPAGEAVGEAVEGSAEESPVPEGELSTADETKDVPPTEE